MIDLYFEPEETKSLFPFDRTTLVSKLEERGLTFRRVEQLQPRAPCLVFAAVDSEMVTNLSADERSFIVLVAEGDTPAAGAAEATRQALGLLGLVEADAWRSWQGGLFVAWGLYGRSDVATVAGLVPLGIHGLQPLNRREPLPAVLARFLLAAERH